jgi:hypothetical protein
VPYIVYGIDERYVAEARFRLESRVQQKDDLVCDCELE